MNRGVHRPGAQPQRLTNNQKYQPKMSLLPQGMVCTTDIVPVLMQMKHDDHDFLAWEDVAKDLYVCIIVVEGNQIECIPRDWVSEIKKVGLLGLINMLHFWWLNEVNACIKHLLACFHGGILWLETTVTIMVDLISDIMGLPKDGPKPL